MNPSKPICPTITVQIYEIYLESFLRRSRIFFLPSCISSFLCYPCLAFHWDTTGAFVSLHLSVWETDTKHLRGQNIICIFICICICMCVCMCICIWSGYNSHDACKGQNWVIWKLAICIIVRLQKLILHLTKGDYHSLFLGCIFSSIFNLIPKTQFFLKLASSTLATVRRFEKCPGGKELERNGQLGQFWVEIRIQIWDTL